MLFSNENRKFLKGLYILALPIVAQDLVGAFVNMLDTFMVSSLGEEAVAAVGLSNQVFFLFALFMFGANSGAAALMGQFWGKNDVKSIRKTMGICWGLSLFVATVFATLAFFIPETIMGIYSNDPAVIQLGVQYLRIVCFSYFLSAISMVINFAMRSTGQTRLPMITTTCALVCSAALNYVFIFILGMGVEGAAISTVIARSIEVILQFIFFRKLRLPIVGPISDYLAIDRTYLKHFFRIVSPVILNEILWSVGVSLYNVAYRECGTAAQSAVQIAVSIQNIFIVFGRSIGSACGIMVANALGASEFEEAIRNARKSLLVAVFTSATMGALLWITTPYIVNFFDISPAVNNYIFLLLRVISVVIVIQTINFICIVGIFRSGGDNTYCLIIDTGCVWLVGLPLAFIGAYYLGFPIYWVFLMSRMEEVAKCIFNLVRVSGSKWVKNLVE